MTGSQTIDVWQVDTDVSTAELAVLRAALSPGERARAAGVGPRKDRWAAGRGALRHILAAYVHRAPDALQLDPSPFGKPSLAGLWFSFSDSGARALVAVSRTGPVGVDIERVDARRPAQRIARRLFTEDEIAALDTPSPQRTRAAFHRCWAAKEAYAKGMGRGLALGFGTFSVAGLADGQRDRVRVHGWDVRALDLADGHAAAIAAPGSAWSHRKRTWNATS